LTECRAQALDLGGDVVVGRKRRRRAASDVSTAERIAASVPEDLRGEVGLQLGRVVDALDQDQSVRRASVAVVAEVLRASMLHRAAATPAPAPGRVWARWWRTTGGHW
jgi:hypothetical protein